MDRITEPQKNLCYESPGLINLNAYNSIALNLCKHSLVTVFKLTYRGGKKKPKNFVKMIFKEDKIRISDDIFNELNTKEVDDYDVTLLKTLLVNPKVCDLGKFVYYTTNPNIGKQSLLNAFKLTYKGGSQNPKEFLTKRKIWIHGDRFQDLKKIRCIDDYDTKLLKILLENPDICDQNRLINSIDTYSCESIMVKCDVNLDYYYWEEKTFYDINDEQKTLYDRNSEQPSIEFWIRKIVNIRNLCSHNQEEKMTEKMINDKMKNLKEILQNMILKMRTLYPDTSSKDKIDNLENIVIGRNIAVPIWKDLTASVKDELMKKVFECIVNDKEIDIRLPALESEHIHLDVPPSKVYLNIKGKGPDKRKISSTEVVKELMDPQSFPNRCMVLVGLPGVGKTTSLFRIKEEHKNATINKNMPGIVSLTNNYQKEFENVEDIEVLIYQALRNNEYKSLIELLHYKFGLATESIIPHSRQLQNTLLERPSIILLDAIDESSAVSDQLVTDIWHIKDKFPNMYVIFTTRGSTCNRNVLKECAGDDYDTMCINVTGLDPSEFLENSGKLIDVILKDRGRRERNPVDKKREALSNLQKIRQKFPPIGTNPLLLTIAVRLVLDPYIKTIDNLQSTTQLIKGMMESLKRRLCDSISINGDIVNEYLDFLGNESLLMLQRNEFMLNSVLMKRLIDKIRSLEIEESYTEKVLQSFLSKKGESVFQHLHAITQSFLAANALFNKMMILDIKDLNSEIYNQIKDIPKEHQQTVLMLLVGILHDHEKDDILNEIVLDVCNYFDFPKYNYYDALKATHIHLFQESLAGGFGTPNKILEGEILNKAPDSINVGEEALEAIKYIMSKDEKRSWPKEITITVQSQPDNILNLKPVLKLLSERNSCLELEIDQCSEELLSNLPENLEKLQLQWTLGEAAKMIEAFNIRLQSLKNLYMLTIFLYEGGSLPEKGLPKLNYVGDLLVLNLKMRFNDNDKDIARAASIMSWACNQRDHVFNGLNLGNAPLSGSGSEKLLDELSKQGVKALWLKVYYAQLAEGEREHLQKKAENFGIRLFVPPGRDILVRFQSTSAALNEFKANPHFTMDVITFGVEMLSATDQHTNKAASLDRIIRAFTYSSSASVAFEREHSSDLPALKQNVKDNQLKCSLRDLLEAMRVADPPRFWNLAFRANKVFSNKELLNNSNYAGCMGIYKDCMRVLGGTPQENEVDGTDISTVLTSVLSNFSINNDASDTHMATAVGGGIEDISRGVTRFLSGLSSDNDANDTSAASAVVGSMDISRGLTNVLSSVSHDNNASDKFVSNAVAGGIDMFMGLTRLTNVFSSFSNNNANETTMADAVEGTGNIIRGVSTVLSSFIRDSETSDSETSDSETSDDDDNNAPMEIETSDDDDDNAPMEIEETSFTENTRSTQRNEVDFDLD